MFIMFFLPANIAHCVDLSFAWDKNTESDLAGYYIYYKTGSSGAPYNGTGAVEGNSPIKIPIASLSDPENPEYTIHSLSDTEASFFVITSYDTANNESDYSNELSFPNAHNDTATVMENSGINNINVTANDDFGGDGPAAADISITSGANNGIAAVNNGGSPNDPTDDSIDYTPSPNFNGTDTVIYEICDSDGDCDTAVLKVTVFSGDDPPTANDDTAEVLEDSGTTTIDVTSNDDFGGDGPAATDIIITASSSHGIVVVNNGGTPNNPTDDNLDYTPNQDFFGTDNVTYEICDSDGDCDTAVLTITVSAVNDTPIANNDTAEVLEDSGTTTIDVISNDDFGGDGPAAADISITAGPGNGIAAVNIGNTLNDPINDSIEYTPIPDFNGMDTVTYEICDSNNDCDTATVTITVTAVGETITLTGLSINGENFVNETNNSNYTATATFNDGYHPNSDRHY